MNTGACYQRQYHQSKPGHFTSKMKRPRVALSATVENTLRRSGVPFQASGLLLGLGLPLSLCSLENVIQRLSGPGLLLLVDRRGREDTDVVIMRKGESRGTRRNVDWINEQIRVSIGLVSRCVVVTMRSKP